MEKTLAPIISLISKSEKAIEKLKQGSCQYTMLEGNLRALHYALSLMDTTKSKRESLSDTEVKEYLKSLDSMITKTKIAQKKFPLGTAQHTLLKNRLHALAIAKVFTKRAH